MFLFFLFVLQLGAATPDDDSHDKGQVMTEGGTCLWLEILRSGRMKTSGDRTSFYQDHPLNEENQGQQTSAEPAATAPCDDPHDKGQVMTEETTWRWSEVLEPSAAADTGNPLETLQKKMKDQFKSCADADLVRLGYGKSPDDMTTGDWHKFYRHHPYNMAMRDWCRVYRHHPRVQGQRMTVGDWHRFYRDHPLADKSQGQQTSAEPRGTPLVDLNDTRLITQNVEEQSDKVVKTSADPESVLDSEEDIAAVAHLRRCFAKYVDEDQTCSKLVIAYFDANRRLDKTQNDMRVLKTKLFYEEQQGMEDELRKVLARDLEPLQGALNIRLREFNSLERRILSEALSKDTDYCPGKALEAAEDFMQLWKKPDFNLCSKGNFGAFLQGLWSRLGPFDMQSACRLGARCAQGQLERHLLDLKYNTPVVAVAIAQAVFEEESSGKEDVLSNEELAAVYAYLKHGGTFDDAAQKAILDLGRSYAEYLRPVTPADEGVSASPLPQEPQEQ